jgi:hypothetical protein
MARGGRCQGERRLRREGKDNKVVKRDSVLLSVIAMTAKNRLTNISAKDSSRIFFYFLRKLIEIVIFFG